MTFPISQRLRRIFAVVLFLLVSAIVIGLPARATLDYISDLKTQINEQRILLGRLEEVIEKRKRGGEESFALIERTNEKLLIQGATDAVRAANVLNLIAQTTRQQGVRMKSTNSIASYTSNGLRFIGVQVTMTATLKQIQNILIALERAKPYVFVATLDVQQTNVVGADPELLDISFSVVGAAMADTKQGAS